MAEHAPETHRPGMIEVISPAGFEHFFRELADLGASGPPPFEQIAALAELHGLQYGPPDWLPDIIARHGLTRPPGR